VALTLMAAIGCASRGRGTGPQAAAGTPPSPATSTARATAHVQEAAFIEDGDGARLVLSADAPLLYTAYEPRPDLLVVDLPGIGLSEKFSAPTATGSLVQSIRVEPITEMGKQVTRLTVAHREGAHFDIRSLGQGLALSFEGSDPAAAATTTAEAGMAAWESKYHYDFWRPITGIRESDPGSGPTGLGDGNPATMGDLTFKPLGAPASNLQGPNFTPPFPAYPSGHATFGGALFQILRRFYGTDHIGFTFVSDEFNGITRDNAGNIRPYMPRHFSRLSQAEEENGQSRIYLGIHWSFDKTEGIAQGRRVANYVYDHAFTPVHD